MEKSRVFATARLTVRMRMVGSEVDSQYTGSNMDMSRPSNRHRGSDSDMSNEAMSVSPFGTLNNASDRRLATASADSISSATASVSADFVISTGGTMDQKGPAAALRGRMGRLQNKNGSATSPAHSPIASSGPARKRNQLLAQAVSGVFTLKERDAMRNAEFVEEAEEGRTAGHFEEDMESEEAGAAWDESRDHLQ